MTSPERLDEYSKRWKRSSERDAVERKAQEFADAFWKQLVKKVGEPAAKETMRRLMGDKKPGPPMTDEGRALTILIYGYILNWGHNLTDRKIAKFLFESNPYYVEFDSGVIWVVNNHFTETYMKDKDETIVRRWPINKSLAALTKQVERVRRWTIEEGLLAQEYAPRPYRRD